MIMSNPIDKAKSTVKPGKKDQIRGRLPAITPEMAEAVAVKVSRGVPLRLALRGVNQRITIPHWQSSLEADSVLASHYETKLGAEVERVMAMLPGRTLRTLPAELWALSRGHLRDEFCEARAAGHGTTFNNCNVQVNANTKAAVRALLRKVTAPLPGEGTQRQIE